MHDRVPERRRIRLPRRGARLAGRAPHARAARGRPPHLGHLTDHPANGQWHRILAGRGWGVPHWPVEHGGTVWTPTQQDLFASECAAADAARIAPMGPGMVGPVTIAFGTPAQQRRWLPGIRDRHDDGCQGGSEPRAGKAQQGIRFLCIDMDLPGISVRPIPSSSGDHELNQVFFDGVRGPATGLVGGQIAARLLSH
jgi:acyl-CoA dehydrogenase